MLFTRECDYAIRVLRCLSDGSLKQVSRICIVEDIPRQYCYKIMIKLEMAEFVESKRGRDGGYRLIKPPESFTLFDVIKAVDDKFSIMHCIKSHSPCTMNHEERPCTVHKELKRIQNVLEKELSKVSFKNLV